MALIKCKECSAAVSDTAATCPQCGIVIKKSEGFIRRVLKAITVGFLALIIFIIVVSLLSRSKGTNSSSPDPRDSQSSAGRETPIGSANELDSSANPTSPAQSNHLVGEIINTKKFEISVTKAEIKNSVGKGFFESKPAEGGVYVAVQWRYKNISEKPVGSFSVPSLHLVDPKKTRFSKDINASGNFATELNLTRKVLSDVNPGITVTAASVFEVSKDSFDPKTWNLSISADKKFEVGFGVMP